jgi:hypothetical protein
METNYYINEMKIELEPRTLGAAMKEISGTLRTIIQGAGSSSEPAPVEHTS